MTKHTVPAAADDDNPKYIELRRRLSTPGVGLMTFSAEETAAFHAVEGPKLSPSKTARAIETEMEAGTFDPTVRRIVAIDSGSVIQGAEYLNAAGKLELPLSIATQSGVDLGAAVGALDKWTLRNSVPREQKFEIYSRVAGMQILRRYRTKSLDQPYSSVPPSVWWSEMFTTTGQDLLHEARFVNEARAMNNEHSIDSFRGPLIAVSYLVLSEVRVRAPWALDDARAFLRAVIAGFRASDTPKDDPARVAHGILSRLAQEPKGSRLATHLDARAFLAVLVGWNAHVAGKGMSARDPELSPIRVVDEKTVVAPQVELAIPVKPDA